MSLTLSKARLVAHPGPTVSTSTLMATASHEVIVLCKLEIQPDIWSALNSIGKLQTMTIGTIKSTTGVMIVLDSLVSGYNLV